MKFTTRFLLTCAAIGAAGGVLLIPVNIAASMISGPLPFAYSAIVGFWLLPFVFALALLRRPGAAILASFIAGCIDAVATPYGVSAIATNLMVGVALEIPFAIGLYRSWRAWIFYVGAAVFGLLYAPFAITSMDLSSMPLIVQVAFVAIVIASELLAVWVARLLARRVERTGVVRGLQGPMSTRRADGASPDGADAPTAPENEAVL